MRGNPSDSRGDGDGWVDCACGQLHWGVFGAAGLLLRHRDRDGTTWVLLQHRAPWSHHGDTWGLPGGARMSTETPWQAAVREADEEAGVDGALVRVVTTYVVDHGPWSYTTVIADVDERFPARATGAESVEVRWVPMDEVTSLTLHPGLAAAWLELRDAVPMALRGRGP